MPAKSLGTNGINQYGRVRSSADCRYSAGIVGCVYRHQRGTTTALSPTVVLIVSVDPIRYLFTVSSLLATYAWPLPVGVCYIRIYDYCTRRSKICGTSWDGHHMMDTTCTSEIQAPASTLKIKKRAINVPTLLYSTYPRPSLS